MVIEDVAGLLDVVADAGGGDLQEFGKHVHGADLPLVSSVSNSRAASSNSGLCRIFPLARRARPPRCSRYPQHRQRAAGRAGCSARAQLIEGAIDDAGFG